MHLTFMFQNEPRPGPLAMRNARRFWSAYRRWFIAGGGAQSADSVEAERALRAHMPELAPIYDELVRTGPDDPLFGRFLTLYRPPAFIGACSMAVIDAGERSRLVRNYDFDPALAEGVILRSAWRRQVLGTADCLWGLVDGLNDRGLALALTFGGRREVRNGFGIPLILRYVLETCRDVDDATDALRAVPSHMAYNVTLLDRRGHFRTLHLHPGGGADVLGRRFATNHQGRIHWPAQARFSATIERARHLERRIHATAAPRLDVGDFLEAPLYRTGYRAGFGTLYTAALDPAAGRIVYRWPDAELACDLARLDPAGIAIDYLDGRGARRGGQDAGWAGEPADAFEIALRSILQGLEAAGRPVTGAQLARLRGMPPTTSWSHIGDLFQPRP